MIRVPGLPTAETVTLNLLHKQLQAKSARNGLRSALMNHQRTFENWPIVKESGDLRAVLGWPAKAVETLGRRSRLEGFTLKGAELSAFGLDEMLEGSQYLRRARMAELNSLVHAVSFEVAGVGDESAGEPESMLTHVSALQGTGDWNGRLGRLTSFLHVASVKTGGDPDDFALYLPEGTWVRTSGSLEFKPHRLGRVPVEPLIYKPRLDRPFGQSRITRSVIFLTRSACRVVVRSEATADLYSAPGLLALGLTADQIEQGSWRTGIGNVVGIPDADSGPADAPQLARVTLEKIQQASQEPHVAQLRAWAQLFAGETSLSVSSLGISVDSNPTSAESYAASREDLIAEAEDANGEWGAAHRRSLLNAWAMREGVAFDEIPTELKGLRAKWRDPRHISQAAAADAFAKIAAVVPGLAQTDAGLELLGLDANLTDRLKAELRRGRAAAMTSALAGVADGDA